MPGAFGVRGGFDSHTFPPLSYRAAAALCRLARSAGAAVLLAAACASAPRAQGAVDPPASAGSRVEVVGAGPSAAKGDTLRKRPWHEQPRFVMARSLVVPGWGQAHNHAWLKAVLVAGAEGYLGVRIVGDQRALDGLLGDIDGVRMQRADTTLSLVERTRLEGVENDLVNRYNTRLDQRLGRQWLLGAALAYALVDAFVDANFRGFDVEFKHDPALPGGPASLPGGSGGEVGVRLLLRRHF